MFRGSRANEAHEFKGERQGRRWSFAADDELNMCTLSIISIPSAHGRTLRFVTNRDEITSRSKGRPPEWFDLGEGLRGIGPVDPDSSGTWVGANTAGVAVALLNLNLEPPPPLPARELLVSRGGIVPSLLRETKVVSAIEGLSEWPLDRLAPFRVIAAGRAGEDWDVFEARWDREEFSVRKVTSLPASFVSSGLGDSLVQPRLALFEQMVTSAPSARAQDAFHRHAWAERPEISVMMNRRGARTVSITSLELRANGTGQFEVAADYLAVPELAMV